LPFPKEGNKTQKTPQKKERRCGWPEVNGDRTSNMSKRRRKMGRILIVEDDDLMLEALASNLQSLGYEVATVYDKMPARAARIALTTLQMNRFSVVITDGLNGQCRQVIEASKDKGIPVILITSGFNQYQNLGVDVTIINKLSPRFNLVLKSNLEQVLSTAPASGQS
jgi:CheY-like chemotaxis protein